MPAPRVLIVDDDDDLRQLCHYCLRAHGAFDVLCAASGEEALAISVREPLDLMLVDLCMPGMDGLAVLDRLRARPATSKLPVVLMTAAGEDSSVDRRDWAGIIQKPFDMRRLGGELQRILAQIGAGHAR